MRRPGSSGLGNSIGAEIQYVCDEEYRLEGSYISECVMGHWSNPPPSCQGIHSLPVHESSALNNGTIKRNSTTGLT